MAKTSMKKRSPLWYELPILLSIIGGVIAYIKIRKDDPKKAKRCLVLGIIFAIPIFIGFGLDPFGETMMISSGSMIPDLKVYDMVFTSSTIPFEEIQVGDIIAFNRPSDHNRIIIHRVAEIIDNDPLTFKTKGDANPTSIPGTDFPITESEYIGKVVFTLPQVGYIIAQLLKPPTNYLIMFGTVIIPIMMHIRMLPLNSH